MDERKNKLYHSSTGSKEGKKAEMKNIGFYVFLFVVFVAAYSYFSFFYFN